VRAGRNEKLTGTGSKVFQSESGIFKQEFGIDTKLRESLPAGSSPSVTLIFRIYEFDVQAVPGSEFAYFFLEAGIISWDFEDRLNI
jgi:hypothetical protein